ncbi:MAG: hypothetical protein LBT20_06365, partial [Clostridiales bacterium]|nr:hypothetical protein [Clostridiales bacterium]
LKNIEKEPTASKYIEADYVLSLPRNDLPSPRKDILKNIEKELTARKYTEQVLLSFIGDVYCETTDDNATTRQALELFLQHDTPIAILTKGGERCLKDIDLFKRFGANIQIGATLTFYTEEKSFEWENGAASPNERLSVLKILHDDGIKTFASFEPVIEPAETIALMKETLRLDCVDTYLIGKLNNYMGMDKRVDWSNFLRDCLALLRPTGKAIYIKESLREAASDVKLTAVEQTPDKHFIRTPNKIT